MNETSDQIIRRIPKEIWNFIFSDFYFKEDELTDLKDFLGLSSVNTFFQQKVSDFFETEKGKNIIKKASVFLNLKEGFYQERLSSVFIEKRTGVLPIEDSCFAHMGEKTLRRVNFKTGEELWKISYPTQMLMFGMAIQYGKKAILMAENKKIIAIEFSVLRENDFTIARRVAFFNSMNGELLGISKDSNCTSQILGNVTLYRGWLNVHQRDNVIWAINYDELTSSGFDVEELKDLMKHQIVLDNNKLLSVTRPLRHRNSHNFAMDSTNKAVVCLSNEEENESPCIVLSYIDLATGQITQREFDEDFERMEILQFTDKGFIAIYFGDRYSENNTVIFLSRVDDSLIELGRISLNAAELSENYLEEVQQGVQFFWLDDILACHVGSSIKMFDFSEISPKLSHFNNDENGFKSQ